ncbi:hypothetical protein YC2023_052646 [Brassica napus]
MGIHPRNSFPRKPIDRNLSTRLLEAKEYTSGRSIDGDADQCLISHTHQAGAPHVLQEPVELSADRLVVELLVQ